MKKYIGEVSMLLNGEFTPVQVEFFFTKRGLARWCKRMEKWLRENDLRTVWCINANHPYKRRAFGNVDYAVVSWADNICDNDNAKEV